MPNKLGKNTPVWYNTNTGEVVCGSTLNEALGVGYAFTPSPMWGRVNVLPAEKRVVIARGMRLAKNPMTLAIAKQAKCPGELRFNVLGRERKVNVLYVDQVRVIVSDR